MRDWKVALIVILAVTTVMFGTAFVLALISGKGSSTPGSGSCANWRANGNQTYCTRWK
jgi:hypothetical protein